MLIRSMYHRGAAVKWCMDSETHRSPPAAMMDRSGMEGVQSRLATQAQAWRGVAYCTAGAS